MNILSLFDGMSCGRIALERAGVSVKNYYASEIDKYAMQVAKANYPDTIHIGDVEQVSGADLPDIDILIGGSPCQGFSFAGKQLNFEDPRSRLFFEYVRLLKECNPKYFLLENVVMKQEYQDVISEALGVEPIFINSSLVSAQSRKRLYWTNIKGIAPPEDKGIVLQDILEPICNSDSLGIRTKSKCIRVGEWKSPFYSPQEWDSPYLKTDKKLQKKYTQHKASCLTGGAHSGGNHSDMDMLLFENLECRRYTPLECERLQTVPDGYTAHVSNTQRYKMLGNGWTVDVIAHMFRNIKDHVRTAPVMKQASIFDYGVSCGAV